MTYSEWMEWTACRDSLWWQLRGFDHTPGPIRRRLWCWKKRGRYTW